VTYHRGISPLMASTLTTSFRFLPSWDGEVELHLTSAIAESVQVRGSRVTLELLGEPGYVEQFPGVDRA
jgi:hypothetical protein